MIISLLICIVIVALAALFASSSPDGLEWVATKIGFEDKAASIIKAPMPDYNLASAGNSFWSTLLSGVVGTAAVFIAAILLTGLIGRKSQ